MVASNQDLTRAWWASRRADFDLYASGVVVDEAMKGDFDMAAQRLEILRELQILDVTADARVLADELVRKTGIPAKAELDALHIAVAAIHGMNSC